MPTRPAADVISVDFLVGTDGNDINADDIPIVDAGNYFTGTNVEAALQELGAGGGGGGGGSDFDKSADIYRFPAGGGYDEIAQENLGDGTDSYVFLGFGFAELNATDGTGNVDLSMDGTSYSVSLAAHDGAGKNPTLALTTGAQAIAEMTAEDRVNLHVTGAAGRHVLYGGVGVQFPQLSAAPGSPVEGLTYYDTTAHKVYTYDGTTWQAHW